MVSQIARNVVVDEPTNRDLFHGKGHERTARSLAQAIEKFDQADRAIGLDGVWGSGKSSVVEIAAKELSRSPRGRPQTQYHFFTFDIWKSQGAGFRRSFLEHFVSWAREEFSDKDKALKEIEESIHGKTQEIETRNQPVLGWFGILALFTLPLLPIYYFWAKGVHDRLASTPESPSFLGSGPMLAFYLFLILALIAAEKKRRETPEGISFKGALSSILLITSKQHQDQRVVQRIREVDPNDYEFHTTLRSILKVIQTEKRKVVVVLDNIDRLPQREIPEYWALVRSIFSRTHQARNPPPSETITAIVPYDRNLIEAGSRQSIMSPNENNGESITSLSSKELFAKTFDEILTISPPVLSNTRDFFTEKLTYALPEETSKDERFRAYRIFNEIVRKEGGVTTPRRVVSFINDLSGLFVLHEGRYSIPTVAAYLAHMDALRQDPSRLNDISILDSRIVENTANPDLAKHLAAMVFNVEPELAFQVLLDDEIANAAVSEEPSALIELSRSSGFDIRVDDVLKTYLDDWVSSGDFKSVVKNFSKLIPEYSGDSKEHVIATLLGGFAEIKKLEFSEEDHTNFLHIFDIAPEDKRGPILSHFLSAAFTGLNALESPSYEIGRGTSDFLKQCEEYLSQIGLERLLHERISDYSLPKSPDYLLGLAVSISDAGFSLEEFGSLSIDLPEESDFYIDIAGDRPLEAKSIFEQFKLAELLLKEDWVQVADTCLTRCREDGIDQSIVAALLELAIFCRQALPKKERNSISLASHITDGGFFRNIGMGDNRNSERAIASAFFILAQTGLGQSIATPTKINPQGQRVKDNGDEYQAFNNLMLGSGQLSDAQAQQVSADAKDALEFVVPWLDYGQKNPEHAGVLQVVRTGLVTGQVPHITLSGVLNNLHYISEVLSPTEISAFMSRYDKRISGSDISKVEIESTPIGLLSAIHSSSGNQWEKIASQVDKELRSISSADWNKNLSEMNHTARILMEKVDTSGCVLDGANYREPLIKFILSVLSGEAENVTEGGCGDKIFKALDESYHPEIWRTARESLREITPENLSRAVKVFPQLLSDIVQGGDRITAAEKDNVIRHILCTALEGRNHQVLEVFVQMGPGRVADYRKSSDESTRKRLEGAVKSFSEAGEGRDWTRKVVDVALGKRRTKTLWEIWFNAAE